jgi:hypothetical protein
MRASASLLLRPARLDRGFKHRRVLGRILHHGGQTLARPFAFLLVLALGAAGCGTDATAPLDPALAGTLQDSQLTRVSAFGVSALVPDGWVAQPAQDASHYVGVAASPQPLTNAPSPPIQSGLIATRVDATEIGVASDLYYLAAKGPVVARMTHGESCTVTAERIFADHAPASMAGARRSPGDFVAAATGTCRRRGSTTRWSYFVAAPGYGPAREAGIPGSGLYLIVASTPAAPGASRTLARMIRNVRFGEDGAHDFVTAIRSTTKRSLA